MASMLSMGLLPVCSLWTFGTLLNGLIFRAYISSSHPSQVTTIFV